MVRDNPDYSEMLRRFESYMDVENCRDVDDLFRRFIYFQNREVSVKQKILLEDCARQKGIPVARKPRPIGISRIKGKPREELRRHYTAHMRKGKRVMVARIPKGMKGAGRFARRG